MRGGGPLLRRRRRQRPLLRPGPNARAHTHKHSSTQGHTRVHTLFHPHTHTDTHAHARARTRTHKVLISAAAARPASTGKGTGARANADALWRTQAHPGARQQRTPCHVRLSGSLRPAHATSTSHFFHVRLTSVARPRDRRGRATDAAPCRGGKAPPPLHAPPPLAAPSSRPPGRSRPWPGCTWPPLRLCHVPLVLLIASPRQIPVVAWLYLSTPAGCLFDTVTSVPLSFVEYSYMQA